MIIQCKSCARKFIVKDKDIPGDGRTVQCGYCSISWHQLPISQISSNENLEQIKKVKIEEENNENLSVEKIKASDGKTYKFLGSQWAQLLPSGKTGLFAKKKIGKELDKLTGRKVKSVTRKKSRKIKELDPSHENIDSKNQLPDLYNPENGMGFFGYIFLLIIVSVSVVGIIKTFEDDWLSYFPQDQYIFDLLDEQLEYIFETFRNVVTIIKDLINSY